LSTFCEICADRTECCASDGNNTQTRAIVLYTLIAARLFMHPDSPGMVKRTLKRGRRKANGDINEKLSFYRQ
jgi:hypothetical protein